MTLWHYTNLFIVVVVVVVVFVVIGVLSINLPRLLIICESGIFSLDV